MEIFEPETGTLCPPCVEEIERCLSRGWSWGVLTKLCNRKWGADFRAAELKKHYAAARRLAAQSPARRDYVAAALEDTEE